MHWPTCKIWMKDGLKRLGLNELKKARPYLCCLWIYTPSTARRESCCFPSKCASGSLWPWISMWCGRPTRIPYLLPRKTRAPPNDNHNLTRTYLSKKCPRQKKSDFIPPRSCKINDKSCEVNDKSCEINQKNDIMRPVLFHDLGWNTDTM